MEYILTFSNTHNAIKGESVLLAENIKVKVMPLPSQIKAGCGLCLRIGESELKLALTILEKNLITSAELYHRIDDDKGCRYQKPTI